MSLSGEALLVELKIPRPVRPRVAEILAITDGLSGACLDREYAELARELVARLARSGHRRSLAVTYGSGPQEHCTRLARSTSSSTAPSSRT